MVWRILLRSGQRLGGDAHSEGCGSKRVVGLEDTDLGEDAEGKRWGRGWRRTGVHKDTPKPRDWLQHWRVE